jgi:hypothetical protein
MFHLRWAITRHRWEFEKHTCSGHLDYNDLFKISWKSGLRLLESPTIAHLNWDILLSYMPINAVHLPFFKPPLTPKTYRYIMIDKLAFEIERRHARVQTKLDETRAHVWKWRRKGMDRVKCLRGEGRGEWKEGIRLRVLDPDEVRAIPISAIREEVGLCGLVVYEK